MRKTKNLLAKIVSVAMALALVFLTAKNSVFMFFGGKIGDSVTVMDVGQAQSVLIQSDDSFALIDAGFAKGNTDVVTYLNQRGVDRLELLVITHFHTDHTSQVLEVLDNFAVDTVLIPDLSEENMPTTSFFDKLLTRAEEGEFSLATAKKDDIYPVGDGEIKVLADTYNDGDVNDTSIALTFTQGDFIYLETGDCEAEAEEYLLPYIPENVTLFNAGHHGSSTSNTLALLEKANPKYVSISCGEDNSYGHPHQEVLDRLKDLRIFHAVTYEEGDLVYNID